MASERAMEWAAQLWCLPENKHREMDSDFAVSIAEQFDLVVERQQGALDAISHPDVQVRLLEIIHELQTGDGEHWAVGEAIKRLVA